MKETLKVYLWGEEIGRLSWHEARHNTYFTFNPVFLRGYLDIAPLTASIHSPQSNRPIFGDERRIYQKLPPFIADSLPDSWGNQLFEQWRKSNRISERNVTPLEKLAFIGHRGMGALEFVPEIQRDSVRDKIDIKSLADLAEKIVAQRENARILPDEVLTMQSLIYVGTSAGGRQPKAIISINKKTGEIRSGQIETNADHDYYIIKFGNKTRTTAEIEQTYYEMAVDAGINMMGSRLLEVEGTNHFLTRRFDRQGGIKLHTQTLAAINPEADSYEKLISTCRKLHLTETDCQEVFRRLVFNILANNTDDHNKNFSFIMDKQGTWRLAPAYDITYIFDTGGYLPNPEHCLMVGGKLCDITRKDVLSFAEETGIRTPETIIRKVATALSSFRSKALRNGVNEEFIGRIETCISSHLSSWNLMSTPSSYSYTDKEGNKIVNAQIVPVHKGNYHIIANINGRDYKYVLRKGTPEHDGITAKGLSNLKKDELCRLVELYLVSKILP